LSTMCWERSRAWGAPRQRNHDESFRRRDGLRIFAASRCVLIASLTMNLFH
jgi:hypothetical protein